MQNHHLPSDRFSHYRTDQTLKQYLNDGASECEWARKIQDTGRPEADYFVKCTVAFFLCELSLSKYSTARDGMKPFALVFQSESARTMQQRVDTDIEHLRQVRCMMDKELKITSGRI